MAKSLDTVIEGLRNVAPGFGGIEKISKRQFTSVTEFSHWDWRAHGLSWSQLKERASQIEYDWDGEEIDTDIDVYSSWNPGPGRYVITWAQNDTPAHEGFYRSLRNYCDHRGARLMVIKGKYSVTKTGNWWCEEDERHAISGRVRLSEGMAVQADFPIIPTAVDPVSGLQASSGESGAIFGHPKIRLKTVPGPLDKPARILTTTGAMTVPHYTVSKAGKKGELHHVLGACIVETDGDRDFVRQINANEDGEFIDCEWHYSRAG